MTKITPKLNVKLLRRVQKAILKHSDQFIMDRWVSQQLDVMPFKRPGGCGTAACIAGWTIALARNHKKLSDLDIHNNNAERTAEMFLGLERDGGYDLFHLGDWPYEMRMQYDDAKELKAKAEVAAARIDRFIEVRQIWGENK